MKPLLKYCSSSSSSSVHHFPRLTCLLFILAVSAPLEPIYSPRDGMFYIPVNKRSRFIQATISYSSSRGTAEEAADLFPDIPNLQLSHSGFRLRLLLPVASLLPPLFPPSPSFFSLHLFSFLHNSKVIFPHLYS